jgi:HD-like signal output (HDOD) protein
MNPDYGRGQHSIDFPWEPTALVAKLRETFHSPAYRAPVLPSVALELMALSRRDDVQIRDILMLLERDSLIAGGVLKLAQAPLYQRGGQVRSLSEAVTRLGLRTLADLCWNVAMNARVFRAPGYDAAMDELRRHSAATAQLARLIGAFVTFSDDYTYTCGLMHDAGAAACLTLLGDVPRGAERPALDLVWDSVMDVHQEASTVLARAWQLPSDVQLIVGNHHQPRIGGKVHPVIAAIALAEALATELGRAGGMEPLHVDSGKAAQDLGLASADLDRLRRSAESVLAELE